MTHDASTSTGDASTTFGLHAERDLPRVRFLSGSLIEREVIVPPTGCTIGRSRQCTIRLDATIDAVASGKHLAIGHAPDIGWWIEDLGSTNGTWLGVERLTGRVPIPIENEFSLGGPSTRGCIRFYVAFPTERRKARSQDPARPRLSELMAEAERSRGTPPRTGS